MTKEELFKELTSGLTRKVDFEKYPDSIFFFKRSELWFEYDLTSGDLWCRYEGFWKVFEDVFSLKYSEIQSFIKNQVEQHFKNKEVTPVFFKYLPNLPVEQHFKNFNHYASK